MDVLRIVRDFHHNNNNNKLILTNNVLHPQIIYDAYLYLIDILDIQFPNLPLKWVHLSFPTHTHLDHKIIKAKNHFQAIFKWLDNNQLFHTLATQLSSFILPYINNNNNYYNNYYNHQLSSIIYHNNKIYPFFTLQSLSSKIEPIPNSINISTLKDDPYLIVVLTLIFFHQYLNMNIYTN